MGAAAGLLSSGVCPAASLRLLLWVVQLLLLPTQQVYDGPGTSWDWLGLFGEKGCSLSMVSTLLFWVGLLSAAGALRWMTGGLLFEQEAAAALVVVGWVHILLLCPTCGSLGAWLLSSRRGRQR